MPSQPQKTSQPAAAPKKKKFKQSVPRGRACISASYNNTIVSITDPQGNLLAWGSSGHSGFKGPKKATPYAAGAVVRNLGERLRDVGLREVDVIVKGVGSGREAAVRALSGIGISILSIKDRTPIPHNGVRPRRPRRV